MQGLLTALVQGPAVWRLRGNLFEKDDLDRLVDAVLRDLDLALSRYGDFLARLRGGRTGT